VEWLVDDRYNLKVVGTMRVRLDRVISEFPYRSVLAELLPQDPYDENDPLVGMEKRALLELYGRLRALALEASAEAAATLPVLAANDRFEQVVNTLCMYCGQPAAERMAFLAENSLVERARRVRECMERVFGATRGSGVAAGERRGELAAGCDRARVPSLRARPRWRRSPPRRRAPLASVRRSSRRVRRPPDRRGRRAGPPRGALADTCRRGTTRAIAEPHAARGVVGLIVAERHDDHRPARAQSLRRRADAAVMHDGRGARKQLGMRRVIHGDDAIRQRCRQFARLGPDEQHRTPAERVRGLGRRAIEARADPHARAAEREHDRRRAAVEEPTQLVR
jgi:hypothetical protein